MNDNYFSDKFAQDFTVACYQVDSRERLRPSAFLDLAQYMAVYGADRLKFGDDQLRPYGCTWVLARQHVRFERPVTHKEPCKILTWHKGLKGLFFGAKQQISTIQAKYEDVSKNVEGIAGNLEEHQVQLLKDVAMFNKLYDMNLAYFHELTMYIVAGEQRLKEVRENDLVKLQEIAAKSGDAMDAQKANDLAAQCDRFEKKLHDLKLTRQISMQMAPQIRLLQNNNSLLVERIQSTLVNTLPLWKNQMVLALGLHHSQQAMQAQRAVTNMTNDLLRKNAETLKMGTIETAKESERGIIDMETLIATNQSLIDTINEVSRIQAEGRQKRAEAEKTLATMEKNLKEKLLTM